MLNTYDNFTNMHFNINYIVSVPPSIETSTKWWNRDYVVNIEGHVFF